MKRILAFCIALAFHIARAQEGFPVNGVKDERPGIYAFTHATIYTDYQTRIEDATLLIEDGRVKAVGTGIDIPEAVIVTDLQGRFIYPAWVEPYSHYGLPAVSKPKNDEPRYESERREAYGWNDAVRAAYNAVEEFTIKDKPAETLRSQGFGAAMTFKRDGIVRGTSAFVALSDGPVQEVVLKDRASQNFGFSTGSSAQEYPNSIMGMVALLRQTYYDAQWYASPLNRDQENLTLKAFNANRTLPQVFEANGNKLRVLLADKVGREFEVQYIIKGNGDEYQRIREIKATGAPLIIPVNFPDAYDVEDPIATLDVSLEEMKHWELAPANAGMLADAGIEFAFTSDGLENPGDFLPNIRKAVEAGLSESAALKALTYTPARYFGMQHEVGSLDQGKRASFIIVSDDIFEEKAKIRQVWILGEKYEISELDPEDYNGKYRLTVGDETYTLEISGDPGKMSAKVRVSDTTGLKTTFMVRESRVTLIYTPEGAKGDVRLTGWVKKDSFQGNGQLENGQWVAWTAVRTGDLEKKEEEQKEEIPGGEAPDEEAAQDTGAVIYPFVAYGWTEEPQEEYLLFRNATVWTLEGEGKIEGADVLVKDGKIAAVGKDLDADGARVVDATGRHLTPGIIDEHSHIALSSVNEGSQSIVAEVRMYDALNSEDIDIYRQLAGGVAASQLLHGSANPVGGQSALVKLRWGSSPEGLKIEGADDFIKFALGENVKQSNWGEDYTVRFPQTRMGVEQVFVDGFTRAVEYGEAKAKYEGLGKRAKANTPAPRKDLELEALLEVLREERFITCHSYVQSEVNMLMKVAEQFDFRVNTFTHILEGYKVADKMAEQGAAGSTFADWWAYKFEVRDAIPYNAALMTRAGVLTAINSDDAEMARRLNQEAAKTIKYGGMSEVEALKMVTLNPARMLHLDHRMGSIKAGKDADLVLWTDHPLSIYARAGITMVDGRIYYSIEKDKAAREWIAKERTRLINKMRAARESGEKTQKPKKKEKHRFDCEDIVFEGINLNTADHE